MTGNQVPRVAQIQCWYARLWLVSKAQWKPCGWRLSDLLREFREKFGYEIADTESQLAKDILYFQGYWQFLKSNVRDQLLAAFGVTVVDEGEDSEIIYDAFGGMYFPSLFIFVQFRDCFACDCFADCFACVQTFPTRKRRSTSAPTATTAISGSHQVFGAERGQSAHTNNGMFRHVACMSRDGRPSPPREHCDSRVHMHSWTINFIE